MDLIRLFLIVSLQIFFYKEIFSKYEIILERVETLLGDKDQILENIDLRVKRANKTQYVFNGTLRLKRPLGNDLKIGFKAFNLAGGQYKMLFGRLVGPFCDSAYEEHMRPTYEEAQAASNFSSFYFGMCPIPADYYALYNYFPTGIGDYLPPYVPGGERWKLSVYVVDGNDTETILGGYSAYGKLRSNYSLLNYGG